MRRLAVRILSLIVKVVIIEAPATSPHVPSCRGCMTSMVSITRDAAATRDLYPVLWQRLGTLCSSSHGMASYLEKSGVKSIFIYNGRVASVRAIAQKFAHSNEHRLRIYEYGNRFGTYRIAKYSIHDFAFQSKQLVDFARETNFAFDLKRATKFINQKLKNRFTRFYSPGPVPKYETVVFGGTPYEYSNALDIGDHLDSDPLLMLKTAASHPEFRLPAAFRIHPNASTSNNQPEFNQAIEALCRELQIELIPAHAPVSSHELILTSSRIMVGGSSIAVDAYFLGKAPIFLGENTYRGLAEEVSNEFPEIPNKALIIAGVIVGFMQTELRIFPAWIWALLALRSAWASFRALFPG